jgi:hypothetical protein
MLGLASRSIPALFPNLTTRRFSRLLALFNKTAQQLVTPVVRCEAIPPEGQYPLSIVDYHRDCYAIQADYMMLEASAARRLDLYQRQTDPLTVVQASLAEDSPVQLRRGFV